MSDAAFGLTMLITGLLLAGIVMGVWVAEVQRRVNRIERELREKAWYSHGMIETPSDHTFADRRNTKYTGHFQ